MGAGKSVIYPNKTHSLARNFGPAKLQEAVIGPDSKLFHVLSLLIVPTIIFYFLCSVQFLLPNSLKYSCFQSNCDATCEALAGGVVGPALIAV